jgi:hypothetical protein
MDHAEVVDADGNTVDLSLPQPEAASEGAETEEPVDSEGTASDGPVTGTDSDESETEEEPAP